MVIMELSLNVSLESFFRFSNSPLSNRKMCDNSLILNGDSSSLTITKERFDVVMFDCDGVLYQSNTVLPGAIDLIARLREKEGIEVKFVTNSSTKSRNQLHKKLEKLGFKNITPQDCFTSGFGTA